MAKGGRVRVKKKSHSNSKKVPEWKKGHSSDSNPKFRLHREAAAVFLAGGGGVVAAGRGRARSSSPTSIEPHAPGNAFLGTVLHNDEVETAVDEAADQFSDVVSLATVETQDTQSQISNFTNCSNPTFGKVHRIWKSGCSHLQNEIIAVLAAVTEVIHEQNGEETETEYFGAFLTALESPTLLTEPQKAATAYLLTLVIRKLPREILRSRFGVASKILYTNLGMEADGGSGNPLTLKYLTFSFGVLLAAQTPASWASTSTQKMMESLVSLCLHDHPRVKKVARLAVGKIVGSSEKHPSGRVCAEWCGRELEKAGGAGKGAKGTVNVLKVLEMTMFKLSEASFKALTETILKLMTLSDVSIKMAAMATLYAVFLRRPSSATLPPKTNAQIILALYDFQPMAGDALLSKSWIQLMCEVHVSLFSSDPHLCASYLPRMFGKTVECMQTGSPATRSPGSQVLVRLLHFCVPTEEELGETGEGEWDRHLDACLGSLCSALSLQSHAIWEKVLGVAREFFKKLGRRAHTLGSFGRFLALVGGLRESEALMDKTVLESTVGAAIAYVGIDSVLDKYPLNLDADAPAVPLDFPRSWLLPLIRKTARGGSLEYFVSSLLPLALKLRKRDTAWIQEGERNLVAVYGLVELQIWDILPPVSKNPSDFTEAFPKLAQILGTGLMERGDLRLTIMESLRNLLRFASSSGDEEAGALMRRYAKNYLPILFNVYTAEDGGSRGEGLAALETIRLYLPLVSRPLLARYATSAQSKLEQETQTSKTSRLLDLIIVMTPWLNEEEVEKVWEVVLPWIENRTESGRKGEKSLQKKAYHFLQTLSNADTHHSRRWIQTHFKDLTRILGNPDFRPTAPAQAYRLQSMEGVGTVIRDGGVEWSGGDTKDFLHSVFQEAVHSLSPSFNAKTRKAAARTFIKLVNLRIFLDRKDVADVVIETFRTLKEGFSLEDNENDVDVVKPVFLSYRLLATEFRNDITPGTVGFLISEFCPSVKSPNHLVAREALELLRTLLKTVPELTMSQFLDVILPAFIGQDPGVRNAERGRNRAILKKLIKEFGPTVLDKYSNETWHKQIWNVKKEVERQRRKEGVGRKAPSWSTASQDGDSESVGTGGLSRPDTIQGILGDSSDESEGEGTAQTLTRHSRKSRTTLPLWLKEDDEEDEVMDLLDEREVGRRVTGTEPGQSRKRDVNRGFPTDKQGRLILSLQEEPEEDLQDPTHIVIGKKRKVGQKERVEPGRKKRRMEDEEEPFPESGYQPGGKGIHRELAHKRFKAKKAQGDRKKKGESMEPYAYLPMDGKALNRRKRTKLKGRFKNLVQGARKGATKGSKGTYKSKK